MKEDPDMINRLLSVLPALVFVLHAQAVQAQAPSQPQSQSKPQPQSQSKPQQQSQGGFLYKSTMPDGKVVYGEVPEKGAVKVDKTRPDTSQKGITAATPKEVEALRKLEAGRAAGAASGTGAVVQAPGAASASAHSTTDLQEMLRKYEAGREKFKEPRNGESDKTAGGASRLNEAYFERQKRYDQGVEALRKELERRSPGR